MNNMNNMILDKDCMSIIYEMIGRHHSVYLYLIASEQWDVLKKIDDKCQGMSIIQIYLEEDKCNDMTYYDEKEKEENIAKLLQIS